MPDEHAQSDDHADLELIPVDDPPGSDPLFSGHWVKRRGHSAVFVPSAVQSLIVARIAAQ